MPCRAPNLSHKESLTEVRAKGGLRAQQGCRDKHPQIATAAHTLSFRASEGVPQQLQSAAQAGRLLGPLAMGHTH